MSAIDLTARVRTKANHANGTFDVLGAHFGFGMGSLVGIANEFGVKKSNEKPATILRGCEHTADLEAATRLAGTQFLVHCKGREFAHLFKISDNVRNFVGELSVSGLEETFYSEDDMADSDIREAIQYKIMFKKVLSYCKVIYNNSRDDDLVIVEVTTQKNGEGAIESVFRGGVDECDILLSITEVTNFDFSEDAN